MGRSAVLSSMVPQATETEHWDVLGEGGRRLGEIFRLTFTMGKDQWVKWLGLKADGQWSYSPTRHALVAWLDGRSDSVIARHKAETAVKPAVPELPFDQPATDTPKDTEDEGNID